MRKLSLLYLLLLIIIHIKAQSNDIIFSSLTTENGLSQFSVNSLYVDEGGMLWIGTREGLNYYNGNEIKTYKLDKNNPNSLFCNTILRITGNKQGIVYLLCTEGVAEFDLHSQRFTTLLQGSINSIYYNDKLYISTKNEIYVLNEKTQHFDLYYQLAKKDRVITSLHLDHNGSFWIGTAGNGVYKLQPNKQLKHPIKRANITSIYEDSMHELWIGSWNNGLYHINTDGEITNLRHNSTNENSLSSNFVRTCCEDDDGNIWIGTFKGLNRYDKHNNQLDKYKSNVDQAEGLTHRSIWSIVKDPQGTLWLGTYFGGVNYFNPEHEIYTRYKKKAIEQKGLSSPVVGCMTEDNSGNLWICTEGGGVNVYDRERKTFRWMRSDIARNSISHNNVKAIYYDSKDEIMWIGTHLGGLNKLDLHTNQFTHYRSDENDIETLPSDIIRDIIPHGDSLIIGTQNGVCLFDPQTGKSLQLFKDSEQGRSIRMVADLFVDSENTLWIAATGEGVYSYRFDTNQLKNYRHQPKQPRSLSNNNVNSITQDSQGRLWFSTSGSGLDLYCPATTDFKNFDMQRNGLLSDCIYEVCESSIQKGDLLLITNQGFSQFSYADGTFRNYNKETGFPLTAVNENAMYITRDGEVFLGGVQGMISFHEKNLQFKPKSYNIILSQLFVNGAEVNPMDETDILNQSLQYTKEITLQANQSMFSIEYATSNFIPANRDEISYRLNGFSNNWNDVRRGQTLITYTNLNAGTYTLIVKAKRDITNEVRLTIHVLPPWYKTWWAYLIYLFMIGSLLIYLIRMYNSRIKLRESLKYEQKHTEDIERLNQSKLRFFTNISHEFRTPLTLIIGQIEILLQIQTLPPVIYSRMLGIYKSSIQLRELITELLDFRKQEQGHIKIKVSSHNLVEFLYENYLLFHEYASNKQINFNFYKEEEHIELWYDQKQMQKVINNLLSNALKHTKSGDTISISVRKTENQVIIEIRDTGVGIDSAEVDKIFDRFYQTDRIDSFVSGAGTGIGLALTKGIIELHHGSIHVESERGKGSCFIISLQQGCDGFEQEQILLQSEVIQQIEESKPLLEEDFVIQSEELEPYRRIPNAKMLIVEDNESIKEMLLGIFRPFYQVTSASDGIEALEQIAEEMPSIILCDVVMPRMSGTELCKQIKSDFNTCHIPIVLLTARIAVEHNIDGLRIGADDYITKPFNTNILISRCNNLVNSRIQLQEKFSQQPQAFAQMLATNPMDKDILDRAMDIIDLHLDDTEFNVNVFARELGIARTNLFTKLKAITGQTPNEFILTIRLKKAAMMLRNNPELNITEISEKIGFSSSRYFSKCFKDVYRVSPMAYRKGEDELDNS